MDVIWMVPFALCFPALFITSMPNPLTVSLALPSLGKIKTFFVPGAVHTDEEIQSLPIGLTISVDEAAGEGKGYYPHRQEGELRGRLSDSPKVKQAVCDGAGSWNQFRVNSGSVWLWGMSFV